MPIEWPEGLPALEEFLTGQGLYFHCRGPIPHSGGEIRWQYGNDKIAVRVSADRGWSWSAMVSDVVGWPEQWWVASELEELASGHSRSSQEHSVEEDMRIIRQNWSAIVEAFSSENRSKTHSRLKTLRAERANRHFGQ